MPSQIKSGSTRALNKPTRGKKKKHSISKPAITLREYPGFQVRRSSRKCEGLLKKEEQETTITKLLQKVEDGLKVVQVEEKGRGVEAAKEFERGEFICEYSGERLNFKDAKEREERYLKTTVGCYMYYFNHKGQKFCVDATEDNGRMGRLLNHCKNKPNVTTKVVEVEGEPFLCLFATRDISIGEQLEYDYGERDKAVLEVHPWLAS